MIEYEEFCKESQCVHYNSIRRLSLMKKTSRIERDLTIARVICQQRCERTAYQFYEWLKEKDENIIPFRRKDYHI